MSPTRVQRSWREILRGLPALVRFMLAFNAVMVTVLIRWAARDPQGLSDSSAAAGGNPMAWTFTAVLVGGNLLLFGLLFVTGGGSRKRTCPECGRGVKRQRAVCACGFDLARGDYLRHPELPR